MRTRMIPRRLPALRRLGPLLLAALFVMVGPTEGLGARECPHHGAPAAHAAPDSDDAHAHEAAHGADPQDAGPHAGPCTCLGSCHTAAAAPLPPSAAVAAGFAPAAARLRVAPRDEVRPAHPLPHVLPYAHAPPRIG